MPSIFQQVNRGKNYIIPIHGLSEGEHRYDFIIDDAFFSLIPDGLIEKGHVEMEVTLRKGSSLTELRLHGEGLVRVNCDVCLEEYDQEIRIQQDLLVKFSTEEIDDPDMISIPPGTTELDLVQVMYDYIGLALPYRKVHPVDDEGQSNCNPEMLKEMEKYRVDEPPEEEDPEDE